MVQLCQQLFALDFTGFSGKKNTTELGSDIMRVEKGGVFVVVSASS